MALQLAMYRGDDATFAFTLTQGGVAVDLTAATSIAFSGRVAADFDEDEAPAFTVTLADGVTKVADQPGVGKGKITVKVQDTVSVDLEPGLYLCDVQVTMTDIWTWPEPVYGVSTLIRLRIKADVTHP